MVLVVAGLLPGAGRAHDSLCGTLGDALGAEAAGLVREWVVQVPFDSSAWRLEQVVVGNGLVVAQSGDGGVAAIAVGPEGTPPAPPGTVLWSQRIGRQGRTIQPAAVAASVVVVDDDDEVIGLNRATGHVFWRETVAHGLAAGGVASGDWIYMPLDINGIIRLAVNPLQPRVFLAEEPSPGKKRKKKDPTAGRESESVVPRSIDAGGSITLPPVRYGNGVAWCTDTGKVITLTRKTKQWIRCVFDLGGTPAGPLLVQADTIFATSNAGHVAAIQTGPAGLKTKWGLTLGATPTGPTIRAGDTLVVPLAAGGALGIDAATGQLLWQSDVARTPLAADAERLWCLDATGRLALLDPATGERLAWYCTGPFTLPVVNTATDRLVLASPRGTVVSLAPLAPVGATAKDAPASGPADPAATPPAADRKADDPSE
jgi:outer membrane protein assembly factor BamB